MESNALLNIAIALVVVVALMFIFFFLLKSIRLIYLIRVKEG